MTFDEYQVLARRTQNDELTVADKLNHALHGLVAEVGEIHSIYQKKYQGHPVDNEKVLDELGDERRIVLAHIHAVDALLHACRERIAGHAEAAKRVVRRLLRVRIGRRGRRGVDVDGFVHDIPLRKP